MKEHTALFKKYLALLEVDKSSHSFELLKKIVKAHLIKVPFENISKLYYKQQGMNYLPNFSQYLDDIENYNFGGTCYANNYYFYLLLEHLGYDIKLCGADMRNPDVHLISIVTIDESEFIVDGGYAAPFLKPLPRDLKIDHVITYGKEKYILKPKNDDGTSRLEQYYLGELKHWYTAKPAQRRIEDFRNVIECSYADEATFMNALLITRFSENGSLVLRNLHLTEIDGANISSQKLQLDDVPQTIEKKFGMPAVIVKQAISRLKELKDVWG